MSIQNLSELKSKISELLSLLKDVTNYINQIDNSAKKLELQEQLKTISRTIYDLESKRITVPDELRNLKTSIVNNLSSFDEINEIISAFYSELNGFLGENILQVSFQVPKNIRKRKMDFNSIHLSDLVNHGIILPNTKVIGRNNNFTFHGIVTDNGKISITKNGISKNFDTPSGAAKYIIGREMNGWDWWFVNKDGRELSLSSFREKYKNQIK